MITQNEFMRRMKDMQAMGGGGGMNFYGNMGDMLNLVVNSNHPLVQQINADKDAQLGSSLKTVNAELDECRFKVTELNKEKEGKKEEEISQSLKDEIEEAENKLDEVEKKHTTLLTDYGKQNKLAKQLIDLALLANNRLNGEALANFVKRSIELIEK